MHLIIIPRLFYTYLSVWRNVKFEKPYIYAVYAKQFLSEQVILNFVFG